MKCIICGKKIPKTINIDGEIKRVSNKRKYCFACSPYGEHNTKQYERKYLCSKCGETDPAKFTKGRYSECKKCRNDYNQLIDRRNREKIIKYLGGKCKCCGYNKHNVTLDLHHLDPTLKDPHFACYRGWNWKRIERELQNCVLLCKNCHAALHAGEISEDDFQY